MARLLLKPRSDGEGLSVQEEGGKVVAVLADHGPYGPFDLRDPSGAPLLKGRKRHNFVFLRWWDAADGAGVRQVSLRFRKKRADIVLADGRELSIHAVGEPPAGRILAGHDGDTVAEITHGGDGKLQISTERPELSTIELLGAVGLWRLAHINSRAVDKATSDL